jgi:phosphodiesterase/alkaline phosphatase D-like protein
MRQLGSPIIGLIIFGGMVLGHPAFAGDSNLSGQNTASAASPFQRGVATHQTRIALQGVLEFPNANELNPEIEKVSPVPPTRSSFMATWEEVSGATGYLLDVSTDESFSSYVDGYHDLNVGDANARVITGLTPGTTYYYRVRPYAGTGPGGYSEAMTATTVPTTGLIIHATFDSSITGNPNAAAIEAMINRAIGIYESLFSDPITIQIRFRYSTTAPDGTPLPPGTAAESEYVYYGIPWSTFINALRADATTSNDHTADASLPGTALSSNINPSSANGRSIGFDTPPAMFADGHVGQGGPYDGIVTLNSAAPYQFSRPTSAGNLDAQGGTEHEIDEVIGLGSRLNTNSNDLRPQDLFSWSSAGVRNITSSGTRYFSINGGVTHIVNFNQDPSGDFGDWLSDPCPQAHPYVQNASGCTGQSADVAATSPEGINLDVIGYNLVNAGVTTNSATNVTSSSATLNGTVNPNGLTTSVHFEYGLTTSYGFSTSSHNYSGVTTQSVTANITGLSPNTTYHFRIVATNSGGTRHGGDRTFRTLSPTGVPGVTTNPATNLAGFSATLNGSVYPHGLTTTVYFQYGTTTGYGHTTASQSKTGNTYQSVSANISGLAASTRYHFRIVATNSAGTTYGADRTLTTLSATGPPVVTTNPATFVASYSATLNGSLDPHGLSTTVYFQYGTTTSYGFTTSLQAKNGNTYQNISAHISGLAAGTRYHFRIVASNSAGTTHGADRTFTTLSPTGPPIVITDPASSIASYSARLNGSLNPHGLSTSVYFQYGTTTSYGLTTAPQSKSGNSYQNVSASISGLAASTRYHFRVVATNSAGTTYGADHTFTTLSATGPPVVITNAATNVTSSSATLNGTVDPQGLTTSVHFQYGTTNSYGLTTANQSFGGNTYQNASANITGLSGSTTYHCRIVAANSDGTSYGSDKTFATP